MVKIMEEKKFIKHKKETRSVRISPNKIVPYRDPALLAKFLDRPHIEIAEVITGALAMGKSEAVLMAGRIVQGALKGNLMKQLGREINKMRESGKIKEDYAENKYGFQSLAELLTFIDSEAPDEDRFIGAKALFFALNAIDVKEHGEELLRYQLFKLTLRLRGSQLILLKVIYDLYRKNESLTSSARGWLAEMSQMVGHSIPDLIEMDETILVEEKLITPRQHPDRSGVDSRDARLTTLGIKLSDLLEKYGQISTES
jgi:hypothetical protein